MLFISSKLHAILDYILALSLVLAPWLIDSSDSLAAPLTLVAVGMTILIMSLLTNYELSAVRIIPLSTHIIVDFVIGLFLLMSPWILGFDNVQHMTHMIVGLIIIAVSAFTVRLPKSKRAVTQYVQWV